jgi:chromosome segregation ATPase
LSSISHEILQIPNPAGCSGATMTTEDDDAVGANLEEACAHESGHVRIAQLEGAEVEWARAKVSGTGTTKLTDPSSVQPLTSALIAVAGRVAEEVLLGTPQEALPPKDQQQLERALEQLKDSTITPESLRAEVRLTIEENRREVRGITAVLSNRANAKVPGEVLMDAATQASQSNS